MQRKSRLGGEEGDDIDVWRCELQHICSENLSWQMFETTHRVAMFFVLTSCIDLEMASSQVTSSCVLLAFSSVAPLSGWVRLKLLLPSRSPSCTKIH